MASFFADTESLSFLVRDAIRREFEELRERLLAVVDARLERRPVTTDSGGSTWAECKAPLPFSPQITPKDAPVAIVVGPHDGSGVRAFKSESGQVVLSSLRSSAEGSEDAGCSVIFPGSTPVGDFEGKSPGTAAGRVSYDQAVCLQPTRPSSRLGDPMAFGGMSATPTEQRVVPTKSRNFAPLKSYKACHLQEVLVQYDQITKTKSTGTRAARDLQVATAAQVIYGARARSSAVSRCSTPTPRIQPTRTGSDDVKRVVTERPISIGVDDPAKQCSGPLVRTPMQSSANVKGNFKFMTFDAALALDEQAPLESSSEKSSLQLKVDAILRSRAFEVLSIFFILCSTVHLGWQTEFMARNMMERSPLSFRLVDLCFMAFFCVECGLRLFVYRSRYFTMWGWAWNIIDFALIGMQVIEMIMFAISENFRGERAGEMLIRSARIMRGFRAIRIFHIMRFADELRLLVSCLLHTSSSFFWAVMLIMLVVYVLGLNFTNITVYERILWAQYNDLRDTSALETWFGSVPRSVLSLFQGLTGGLDWNDMAAPLIEHCSPWMGVLFFGYSAFSILAVMNVVTAAFVQQAIDRAHQVKDMQKMTQAARLFKSIDINHSGHITYEELETHLESKQVQEFFESIDVDVCEARWVFEMLDYDNSGSLEFGEFLTGVIRLQGPAKVIDLVMVMRELKETLGQMQQR